MWLAIYYRTAVNGSRFCSIPTRKLAKHVVTLHWFSLDRTEICARVTPQQYFMGIQYYTPGWREMVWSKFPCPRKETTEQGQVLNDLPGLRSSRRACRHRTNPPQSSGSHFLPSSALACWQRIRGPSVGAQGADSHQTSSPRKSRSPSLAAKPPPPLAWVHDHWPRLKPTTRPLVSGLEAAPPGGSPTALGGKSMHPPRSGGDSRPPGPRSSESLAHRRRARSPYRPSPAGPGL